MRTETQTLAQLKLFFIANPHRLALIIEQPSHVEVWEEIFLFIFGEQPKDDTTKVIPSYWRPGSTDPRWDTLIHTGGALRAMCAFLEEYKRSIIPPCKEAA
jgi:hypothetical protein